jgi:glycosyltransferase involved in cell wall biosynthesis
VNIAFNNSVAPSVSVVIPLYNKGKYIERALSSVLAQTFPPLEIIVIDDGSTDDGPEKVLNFNHEKITLIRQENKGPGAARNAGLAMAKGKYISFLDADDEWLPSFIETGISLLENKTANVRVACLGRIKYPEKISKRFDGPDGVYEINSKTSIKEIKKIYKFQPSANFKIMQTEVVKKLGGFFDRYKCLGGEDQYLTLKLLFNERIGIISSAHGIYHTEASDLSGRGRKTYTPAPFFIDPEEILLSCPTSKRHLLQQLLSDLLYARLMKLIIRKKQKEAKELFSCFTKHCCISLKQKVKFNYLFTIAPILPSIRTIWHIIKPIYAGRKLVLKN